MKIESSLSRTGELLLVECEVRGPAGSAAVRLVLDTGAAATTLMPRIVERIGYKPSDSYKVATVRSAIGKEQSYWLSVEEFTALGVATPAFELQVFDLGYDDIDGLLGMNFLRHFNFEVRPKEQRILSELIAA